MNDKNTQSTTQDSCPLDFSQCGAVNSITDTSNYQRDPLAVFHSLCADKNNTLLLESAEIDKKHQLKSLLLTDTAVKIVCNNNIVHFHALSQNGRNALTYVQAKLSEIAEVSTIPDGIVATFPMISPELDERSRLLAINAFQSLRAFQSIHNCNEHPFAVFLGGAFAFDMMSMSEQLPEVIDGENSCPDFVFYLAETLIVIDHEQQTSDIIANVFSGADYEKNHQDLVSRVQTLKTKLTQPVHAKLITMDKSTVLTNQNVQCDISDQEFCTNVDNLKAHILAGDIFQVVPSRTFSLPCANTLNAYKALKHNNPSPYMFYLQDSDFCIFGASPESALKYQQSNRQVEIYPIAGTRPRGFNTDGSLSPDLDSRIELDLRLDKKELAEHIMLVDLARNDIARVSQPGTRHVADLLKVDRYSHVMHLVSRVCGTLETELDALHAYQACMNMGTLSGAPKVKATSLIRKVEGKRRGSYGGAVGYLTGYGDMDTCIVIRSAFVKNHVAQIQAGAGVVFDSDPQAEANETRQKAQAVITAITEAETKQLVITHNEEEVS